MSQEKKENLNVYGENHPKDEGENTRGIREDVTEKDKNKSTAEQLDDTRERMAEEQPTSGGMGREGTPKDGPSQGQFQGVGEDQAER